MKYLYLSSSLDAQGGQEQPDSIRISLTNEDTIFPKAAPIMMPTANPRHCRAWRTP